METQLTDLKGRHCRRRLCCYYFKVNKLKNSFPVPRGDCPIMFLELFRDIRIYASRYAARGLYKRSCACALYLVNGRAAAELLVWWQDRLRLCRCQRDHAQPNCQNHKRQQHYHFWHCVFRRIMPIKHNRYFPHSIVRRSSPPGVAHVTAVCRVPYRSVHESKGPTGEDQIWQSCKEVHSKRPPRQEPSRYARGAPGCSLAGKEAPGTTCRHPNGPSPKQPSPCRPHIMALRTGHIGTAGSD